MRLALFLIVCKIMKKEWCKKLFTLFILPFQLFLTCFCTKKDYAQSFWQTCFAQSELYAYICG